MVSWVEQRVQRECATCQFRHAGLGFDRGYSLDLGSIYLFCGLSDLCLLEHVDAVGDLGRGCGLLLSEEIHSSAAWWKGGEIEVGESGPTSQEDTRTTARAVQTRGVGVKRGEKLSTEPHGRLCVQMIDTRPCWVQSVGARAVALGSITSD